jgi:membrane fusion protein (multidrug efflux system)
MDPIKVEFSIPEKYGRYVRVGSPIRFTVQGDSTVYQAAIYAIDPSIDVATRSIKLRARSANPAFKLRPGAFAKVELELERIMDAIALPSQAIIPELGGQKVYRLKGGKAEAIKIEVGIRTESEVQVTKGLQNGDTILTTGIMQLKPGSPVLLK